MKDIKLKVIYLPATALTPYKNNAKLHPQEQIDQIKKSINEFGMNDPIAVWGEDNLIVEGHGRLIACQQLGIKEVPVIRLDDLTEEQRRAYTLTHNQLTMNTGFDSEILKLELDEINLDMADYGFDEIDLGDIEVDEEIEEDEAPEPPKEPKTKVGDIYKLGNHRLMCGDSTREEDIKKLMDGARADMLFTDPPYNVAFNGRGGEFEVIENDKLDEQEFRRFINATVATVKMLKPEAYYIWCNWKFYGILQSALEFKNCIVWAKNNFGLGNGYRHQHEFCLFNGKIDDGVNNESDLWMLDKDIKHVHPTQKPINLCARALNNHKGLKNIVDIFGGSGSTLIACEYAGRNCYTMEIDPKYVDVIIERWEKVSGKKAQKVE